MPSNRGSRSTDGWKKRKVYDRLTLDVLKEIPDSALELALVDYIGMKIGGDFANAPAIVGALRPGFRALYAIWVVEAEVNNGGFSQFFWSSSRAFAADAVHGFGLFRLHELARLMKLAITIARADEARVKPYRERGTTEAFMESEAGSPLHALDDLYYGRATEVSPARVRFIRAHPEEFVGD